MSSVLVARVLDVWERGADLTIHERAALVLELDHGHRDPATLAVHERDAILIDLRRDLFGDRFDGVVACPACATAFDLPIDLAVLDPSIPSPAAIRVEADDCAGEVRAPLCADFLALDGVKAADYASALFARCVVNATRGGEAVAARDLTPAFRAAAASALAGAGVEAPATDLSCGECGHAWRAPIDIARTLLADLDDWARRLLDDVHRLASAYHWSERDILGLPPRRRLFYLEAIG
jgi:hypothetical protein